MGINNAVGLKFEVQTLFSYGWDNCWTDEDGQLVYFDSAADAQHEIDELISDVKAAVEGGDMSDEYDPEDYRIMEVEL